MRTFDCLRETLFAESAYLRCEESPGVPTGADLCADRNAANVATSELTWNSASCDASVKRQSSGTTSQTKLSLCRFTHRLAVQ